MDCIQQNVCNCLKDCNCDAGYDCCSEQVPKGNPTYGLCIKQGYCDKKRGIPMKSCKASVDKHVRFSDDIEQYIYTREGYNDDDCKEWKKAMVMMVIIVGLLLLLAILMYKNKNLNR